MNVLFFGSTDGTAGALHYFTSLVRLGHNVLAFDPRYFEARNPIERLAIRWHRGPTPAMRLAVAERLDRIIRANSFDLVFVMSENFLGEATLREIRKHCRRPPRFLFHSHDNVFSAGICKPSDFERTLATYDFLFTTKSQNVARYCALGQREAYFVPSAFEPTVHRPISAAESRLEKELEVSFIGTYDRSRIRWCEAAGWKRLEVWGNGWRDFPEYRRHQSRIHTHAIYYFEFADVISRSRCALGLLREEADDLHTQRTFEIPACGTLQIAPRNDEILSFFKEDTEILCFSTPQELREKIDDCLAHPEKARKIAQRGRQRVMSDGHTYQDRVGKMLEIVEAKVRPVQIKQVRKKN